MVLLCLFYEIRFARQRLPRLGKKNQETECARLWHHDGDSSRFRSATGAVSTSKAPAAADPPPMQLRRLQKPPNCRLRATACRRR